MAKHKKEGSHHHKWEPEIVRMDGLVSCYSCRCGRLLINATDGNYYLLKKGVNLIDVIDKVTIISRSFPHSCIRVRESPLPVERKVSQLFIYGKEDKKGV